MKNFLKIGRLLIVILGLSCAKLAMALEPYYFSEGKLVASGYDVVAYFTKNNAIKGDEKIMLVYDGAEFHFSSEQHKKMFLANPKKYIPQYGGYCAYAVGNNYTASSDPEAWTIHNGKLYLNYNKLVRGLWAKKINSYIESGNKNWVELLKQ